MGCLLLETSSFDLDRAVHRQNKELGDLHLFLMQYSVLQNLFLFRSDWGQSWLSNSYGGAPPPPNETEQRSLRCEVREANAHLLTTVPKWDNWSWSETTSVNKLKLQWKTKHNTAGFRDCSTLCQSCNCLYCVMPRKRPARTQHGPYDETF